MVEVPTAAEPAQATATLAEMAVVVTNGTAIVGRYRIEGRLGVGGMSTVQLAFDQRLERYVAIKLLAEHLADDPTFVSRFRREALSAARLVHPNIVQVFDFGFDEEAHQHFIVMEHVPGHSCAELLRDHGPMGVEQAVDVVTQACRGLDYAHRNGVVHRDVKPGNLLVSDSDVVKLADFGIARATNQSSITQVGSVLGTAAYLAPEQARGDAAGPRADLYSLGVVTYQLLTGRLPYEANSLSELALKQQREPPSSADELNPRVPPELADAISIALSLDQEDRPETALLLAEAITSGARGIEPSRNGAASRRPGETAATRLLSGQGSPTAQTRVAPPTSRTSAQPRAARRIEPRRPAYPPPMSGYGPDEGYRAPAKRSGGSRAARRFFALLAIVVLFVAAVAVAVTIAASTSNNVVHYRKVVAHDTSDAVKQLQNIISQYTK
jgi:serine/threonine protein kinase